MSQQDKRRPSASRSAGARSFRVRRTLSAGLPWLLLALLTSGASALTLDEQRAEYRSALADLYAVRLADFDTRLARLDGYPLLPYLHYQRLMRYISAATPEEVTQFRTRFAETPLADRTLRQWLDNLARRNAWAIYREHYDAEAARDTRFACRYHQALLETGATQEALAGARRLWLVDHSQPDACDPLFKAWQAAGGIDDELAWQRLHMVIDAGRPGLGSYLSRFLSAGDSRRLGEEYLALHRSPQRLARLDQIVGGDGGVREAQVVAHTLQRLARRDHEQAEAQWTRWRQRLEFTPDQAAAVRQDILRYQARRSTGPDLMIAAWPPAELADQVATELVEELARDAIAEERWEDVSIWIQRLPEWTRAEPNWQYWQARTELDDAARSAGPATPPTGADTPAAPAASTADALASEPAPVPAPQVSSSGALGVTPIPMAAAQARLETLSTQRNYYGFLAADQLDRPYVLAGDAANVSDAEIAMLKAAPALTRAIELRAIGELPEARREIRWLMDRLDDRSLLALAEYSRRIGWHRQSIQATIAAEHWDQIDLRFPLAYADEMMANAEARDLPPNWLFAVARAESAFMRDARSVAGALGIMQVMPATARMTARRFNIPLKNNWALLDEGTNIEIGSTYLQQMYERYDRNRILASAAYNAGPGRVDRWVTERDPNPADVFVEGIPFRETRRYVQNILAFSLIYSMRLGEEAPFLYDNER